MSETYYKVLASDGSACHGGNGVWHRNGKWMPAIEGKLVFCDNGYHLCRRQDLVHWLGPEIWIAKANGEIMVSDDKIVCRRARLVRRIKGWNERSARLFAADCAERVLPIYEKKYPDDDRPRQAIEAARKFAEGEIGAYERRAACAAADAAWGSTWSTSSAVWSAVRSAVRSAARDDVWAAAWDAAWAVDIAYDAERRWQTERLFDYLEGRAG